MLTSKDFNLLKESQFCDNPKCSCYRLVRIGNIRIHSRSKGQVYCSVCKNRWVITKGTIQYRLKTPIKKVIETLDLLAKGNSLRGACREQEISTDTAKTWIEKALQFKPEFSAFMKDELKWKDDQMKKFWSFFEKRK